MKNKELQELEEGPEAEMYLESIRATLKKYQIGRHQAMMAYMDTDFKEYLHSQQTGSSIE